MNKNTNLLINNYKFSSLYIIYNKIQSGTFGSVYNVIDYNNINENLVIKLEKNKKHNTLKKEYEIYKILNNNYYVPKFYNYKVNNIYNMLIIENAGLSLDIILSKSYYYNYDYYIKYNIKYNIFHPYLINLFINQGIEILNYLKKNNILHKDIKPANFVIKNNHLRIIDFGLASFYNNNINKNKNKNNNKKCGNLRFCSINMYNNKNNNYNYTYNDDLESFLFTLIYFIIGYLPWQLGLIYEYEKKDNYNINKLYNLSNTILKHWKINNNLNININYNIKSIINNIILNKNGI